MSGGPFLCYRQLVPTSGVLFARFFIIDETDHLVTATVNTISVYALCKTYISDEPSTTLFLLQTFHLFGRVNGIECVRCRTLSAQERIVVSLDDGKLVVLEFSPLNNELHIVYMYNAEEGGIGEGVDVHADSKGKRKQPGLYGSCPSLAVDSSHQLACSVIYGDQFFFVSMRDPFVAALGKKDVTAFLCDLSIYFPFPQVHDVCFVPGFGEPTLAVLLSRESIPIGHEKHRSNLAIVAVFAVDVNTSLLSLLWCKETLPNDSHQLIPVTSTCLPGSLFVVGTNSCILISTRGTCGWASNGLANVTVSPSIPLRPFNVPGCPHGLELHDSKWMQHDENTLICSLRDGRLLAVSLAAFTETTASSPRNFEVKLIASSVVCTCFVRSAANGTWFMGSANGDSILLTVHTSKDIKIVNRSSAGDASLFVTQPMGTPALKRRRLSRSATPCAQLIPKGAVSSAMSPGELLALINAEETMFYGATLNDIGLLESMVFNRSFSLRVTDVIPGLGPLMDGLCSPHDDSVFSARKLHWSEAPSIKAGGANKINSAAAYIAEREQRDGLQISVGTGNDGNICRCYSGYRVNKVATREFGDCISVNSFELDSSYISEYLGEVKVETIDIVPDRNSSHVCSLIFLSINTGTTKLLLSTGSGSHGDANKKNCKSREQEAFATPQSGASAVFTEIDPAGIGFVGEHSTLRVGTLCNGSIAIQITKVGIRVTEFTADGAPTPLQDVIVEESVDIGGMGGFPGETIVQGDMSEVAEANADRFVVVLSSSGRIYILKFDIEERSLVVEKVSAVDSEMGACESAVLLSAGSYSCLSIFHGTIPPLSLASEKPDSSVASLREYMDAEESYLYGSSLVSDGDKAMYAHHENNDVPLARADSYLILCDQNSSVHCVRLSDMKLMFCSDPLGSGKRSLKLYESPILVSSCERVSTVIDVRMCVIGRGIDRSVTDKYSGRIERLTIVACLDSADVVLYTRNGSSGSLSTFIKVSHSVVSRRPKRRMKLKRSFVSHSSGQVPPASDANPLDNPLMYNLRDFTNLDGRQGVLCSGLRPLIVVNDTGLPSLLPISFPELPFASTGYYSVTPICCAGGSHRGICSLWVEVKSRGDIVNNIAPALPPTRHPSLKPGFQPPLPLQPKPPSYSVASILGIYREISGLTLLPNSSITFKKSYIGRTVHHIQEVLPKTDDKIQLSLLKYKTFVLSSSLEAEDDFKENVLTEEEMAEDKAHYDRYFPSLKSFGHSSDELGAPPSEKRDQHSILLVQNNCVADEYKLPPFESVLGVETLYFDVPVSKRGDLPNAPQQNKKTVFIAACTSIDDRHGDDSQAEGRILFFSVDYALYEGSSNRAVETEQKEASNKSMISEYNLDAKDGEAIVSTRVELSTTQANFLDSISPKLKLLWAGPGPSTVIKQLGSRYVIATLGSVLYIYNYNPETAELDQLSFYFAPVRTVY